jgi:hypothetical protein
MLTTLIVAIGLMSQQPAAKNQAQRLQEEHRVRVLLEGMALRGVTPGETLFVGPPPGSWTVVALTPKRGVDQMMDLLLPGPGNQLNADHDRKITRAAQGWIEYTKVYIPFRARAISTTSILAPVRDVVFASDGPRAVTTHNIRIPLTCVTPLEGPLQGKPIWVLHANFYVMPERVAGLSYQDRVNLWERLAKPVRRKKTRLAGR